ncbi:MAG: hypothetical protein ACKVVT_18360 [Dehalococcoidia bacterium]
MANEAVQKYFDTLLASYDILVDAVEKANDRGMKVTKAFASDITQGQREAIALGKQLAGEPSDVSSFYTAMLQSTTEAQGRMLSFTQLAYQEALGAGTDARETVQALVEANKETTKAAMDAARSFAAANPWADVMQKGMAAFTPKAAEPKKAAAKA